MAYPLAPLASRQNAVYAPDLLPNEIGRLVSDEIADTGELKVSVRILRQNLRVRRVVALLSEDGGEAVCPDLLHAVQYAELIIDHHIAAGRVQPLYSLQLLLLVDVDQHVAIESLPQAER